MCGEGWVLRREGGVSGKGGLQAQGQNWFQEMMSESLLQHHQDQSFEHTSQIHF